MTRNRVKYEIPYATSQSNQHGSSIGLVLAACLREHPNNTARACYSSRLDDGRILKQIPAADQLLVFSLPITALRMIPQSPYPCLPRRLARPRWTGTTRSDPIFASADPFDPSILDPGYLIHGFDRKAIKQYMRDSVGFIDNPLLLGYVESADVWSLSHGY